MTIREQPDRVPLFGAAGIVGYALVDPFDLIKVARSQWHISGRYAMRTITVEGKPRNIFMHHQILGPARRPGLVADHINGNTLDNRRGNLRWVTVRQNCTNRAGPMPFKNSKGLPRGVMHHARLKSKPYQSYCFFHGKKVCGPYFSTAEAAGRDAERLRTMHGYLKVAGWGKP